MEQYIGFALAVAVLYVAYKYYEKRKNKRKLGDGGVVKDSRPPTQEK